MAEFRFYGVAEDVEGIFASLSERGDLKFIPCRSYPTAEYITLKGVRTEEERLLSQNRQWYILGKFTKEPVPISKVAENHFTVCVLYGGPVLTLTMPPLHRVENGIRELVSGDLSHPRALWIRGEASARRMPEEVKAAYVDLIKTIKLHLIRRKFDMNVWIGRHASKAIDEGKAIILVDDAKWWDGKGNFFVRPNIRRVSES